MARLAPSILAADYGFLAAEVAKVEPEVEWLHLDVMDAHFVPNLTIGPPVVAALRHHSRLTFDCHLMMANPLAYLEAFKAAGADLCSVHVEAVDPGLALAELRRHGLPAALAINPETPFEVVSPWLGELDMVLFMTVHPGFGGQAFIPEVLPKLERARDRLGELGREVLVEVDGGIDLETAVRCARAGANVFVAGTAIFGREDPAAAARELRSAVEGASEAMPAGDAGGQGGDRPAASAARPSLGGARSSSGLHEHTSSSSASGRGGRQRAKVLTVSDGVVAGTREDRSGAILRDMLVRAGFEVVENARTADGRDAVVEALLRLCDGFAGLVVTTGGTGFGPRDLTPEGTRAVLERPAPGLAEAMRQVNPLGRLSRAEAGTRGSCLILNTPGSPSGAGECLAGVIDVLPHALSLLLGTPDDHPTGESGPGRPERPERTGHPA